MAHRCDPQVRRVLVALDDWEFRLMFHELKRLKECFSDEDFVHPPPTPAPDEDLYRSPEHREKRKLVIARLEEEKRRRFESLDRVREEHRCREREQHSPEENE
jgi:hypothetical protein